MNNTEASQAQVTEAAGEGNWITKAGPCVRQLMTGAVLLLGTVLHEDRDPTKQVLVLGMWWQPTHAVTVYQASGASLHWDSELMGRK